MITVIDYGMGNLRSVSKALEHFGAEVTVSGDPQVIQKADKVVLPGVGAFGDAMHELETRGLIAPVQTAAKTKPFLGICLGLQLLFDSSEESPNVRGLGILPGDVRRFRSADIKIPHMGWNQVAIKKEHPLFKNMPDQSFFYFVHSFYAVPAKKELVAGETEYGKETFASIVADKNIFATQFHPEKSQKAGLTILKNFVEL